MAGPPDVGVEGTTGEVRLQLSRNYAILIDVFDDTDQKIRSGLLGLVSLEVSSSWIGYSARVGIWLRDTGAKMFNTSRIPQTQCDFLLTKPPPTDHDARRIIVMLHDWFYAVEVLDKDMRILEPAEIEQRLLSVVADADSRLARGEVAPAVGVLTTDDRDRWAEVGV